MAGLARGVAAQLSRTMSLDYPDARSASLDCTSKSMEAYGSKTSDYSESADATRSASASEPAVSGNLTHAHSMPARTSFYARRLADSHCRASFDVDAPPCARFPYSQPPIPSVCSPVFQESVGRLSMESAASKELATSRSAPMPIHAVRHEKQTDAALTDSSANRLAASSSLLAVSSTSAAPSPGHKLSAAEAERAKSYREWHDVFYASSY